MFSNSRRALPVWASSTTGEKHVFRVAEPDGKTAVFRDEPVRFLVVARDPQTGEMMPVMKRGEPEYLYLCREDRERG